MKRILIALIASFGFISVSHAFSAGDLLPQHVTILGYYGYAPLSGFMQIPIGGGPGTSSIDRPKFNEIGINHSNLGNGAILFDWRGLGIYGMYQYNRPDGSKVLTQNLMSHGVFIPAGTNLNVSTEFDLYRAGVYYKFYLLNDRLIIYPMAEATVLDFSYRFSAPLIPANTRHFTQITGRLGVGGEYDFTKTLALVAHAVSSIPDATNLDVVTANADLKYTFFTSQYISTSIFGGIAYQYIDFKDSQRLPNHIKLNMGPIGEVGLAVTFG